MSPEPRRLDPRSRVQGISYPRSGYTVLSNMLLAYFGPEFRRCDRYGHCRQTPCSDPRTLLQKDHDLRLRSPILPDVQYLVLFRNPIESIASWWEFDRSKSRRYLRLRALPAGPILARLAFPERRAAWRRSLRRRLQLWRRFIHKWVLDSPPENAYFLPYHRFLAAPAECFLTAIALFRPEEIDEARARAIVRGRHIRPRRRLSRFRYFDESRLRAAERSVAPELMRLEIPSFRL